MVCLRPDEKIGKASKDEETMRSSRLRVLPLLAAVIALALCAAAAVGMARREAHAPAIVEYGPTFRSHLGRIALDGKGSVWIAESDGIARLTRDGQVMQVRRPDDCAECVWIGAAGGIGVSGGDVWVHAGGRLLHYHNGGIQTIDFGRTAGRITAFAIGGECVYVGFSNLPGLTCIDASGRRSQRFVDDGYVRYAAAGNGVLWLVTATIAQSFRGPQAPTLLTFHSGPRTVRYVASAYFSAHSFSGQFAVAPDGALVAGVCDADCPRSDMTIARVDPDGSVKELAHLEKRGPFPQLFGTLAAGRDGSVWFTRPWQGIVGRVDASGTLRTYQRELPPGTTPYGIAVGRHGLAWVSDSWRAQVVHLTPGGHLRVFGNGLAPENTPGPPVATSDGAVWFYETLSWHPRLVRIAPDGSMTEIRDPICLKFACYNGSTSVMQATGRDVRLIGTAGDNGPAISYRVAPDGSSRPASAAGCFIAAINVVCLPGARTLAGLGNQIVRGPDGNLWFADPNRDAIGRVTPGGHITYFTRGLTRWDSGPQYITVGPDGALWFTEMRDRIGRITTGGKITEFPGKVPFRSFVGGIVTGRDGNLWFTLYHGNELVRMTTSGVVTRFRKGIYPSRGNDYAVPDSVPVLDTQGRIWFNEPQGGRVARATLATPLRQSAP